MAVEQRGVGAVAQQQRADLHTVLGGRLVERGELPQVHRVDTRAMLRGDENTVLVTSFSCVANIRS